MGQVFVHRPWFRFGRRDWDFHLIGIVEEVVSAFEGLVELGDTPWCNDFDGGLQGIESELETNLIIAFPCAAMTDKSAVLFLRNGDLTTSNDWTGE
jgi:hypothetical protein